MSQVGTPDSGCASCAGMIHIVKLHMQLHMANVHKQITCGRDDPQGKASCTSRNNVALPLAEVTYMVLPY